MDCSYLAGLPAPTSLMDKERENIYHSLMTANWTYEELEECASTFDIARKCPAWSAVSCIHQHQGRGRFNRSWFGERGGLWVSYNVPYDEKLDRPWGQLPLLAGLSLIESLAPHSIEGLRLRWPNDLLVGRSKLAGILVERPHRDMASIGIGINVNNNVLALSGKTTDPPTRLADLTQDCPSIKELRERLAARIARNYKLFISHGMEALQPALQQAWGAPRPVVAITDNARHCGFFHGIKTDGSPLIRDILGNEINVPGIEINRLKELI